MLTAITNRMEIKRCQKSLEDTLKQHVSQKEVLMIGHPGEAFRVSFGVVTVCGFQRTAQKIRRYHGIGTVSA